MVQPVHFLQKYEHCAFLSYCSCFLQLLCRATLILHTLCLPSSSMTTTSLACSPIASPGLSCFLQYFLFRLYFTIKKRRFSIKILLTRRKLHGILFLMKNGNYLKANLLKSRGTGRMFVRCPFCMPKYVRELAGACSGAWLKKHSHNLRAAFCRKPFSNTHKTE